MQSFRKELSQMFIIIKLGNIGVNAVVKVWYREIGKCSLELSAHCDQSNIHTTHLAGVHSKFFLNEQFKPESLIFNSKIYKFTSLN